MSFEAEWAQLKVNAQAQQSTSMQLNQVPADPGGGSGPAGGAPGANGTLHANATSINGSSHLLIEIAGFLHEGRPDGDLCTMARKPRAHADVAAQVDRFARFADDQFLDTVAFFAALATNLKSAGNDVVTVDDANARRFLESVLQYGEYVAPEAKK
ncbi:hypothetical protein OG883_22615 [Streptomyces sp. NBC_01142]|uniref:hypothetical protein n=1 Tax=Streptomyces sp. NBC_01142 TaxID=2975865 RepID=UPI00224D383A|nr:hypothetical protein [Streptomyces sp. NBC_01142]MCX4822639.1 hypothetical protein [Streptomyces sp. NBC_01142]